jgi:hypothetical protein
MMVDSRKGLILSVRYLSSCSWSAKGDKEFGRKKENNEKEGQN